MFLLLCAHVSLAFLFPNQSVQAEDWFHGLIKRTEAEKILLTSGTHGSYLIRESESKPGEHSLSVREGDNVKHYRIRNLDAGGEAERQGGKLRRKATERERDARD